LAGALSGQTGQRRQGTLHESSEGEEPGCHCTAAWARITSTMPRITSGEFYRKMKWRLGAPELVTATAHKLARIVYHLLSTREPYSESVLAKCDQLAYASRTTAA
jgi:hypothetical protein